MSTNANRLCNHYSQEGARVVQSLIREYIIKQIHTRYADTDTPTSSRVPLEFFVSTVLGMSSADRFSLAALQVGRELWDP